MSLAIETPSVIVLQSAIATPEGESSSPTASPATTAVVTDQPVFPLALLVQAIENGEAGTGSVSEPEQPAAETTCLACCSIVDIVPDPREAPSSSAAPALQLPCPFAHVYCVPCLNLCISTRLEDGRRGRKVFPMACPDCPAAYGWWYIDTTVAEKVLSVDLLDEWKQQQLLEAIPKMYCPNPRCSEVVQLPDSDCAQTESECPACNMTICVPCRSIAHPRLSCARWQKSPDSLNPEEIHLRKLAKRHHWRRCTQCRMIVERTEGCSHMSCRCGREFCHQCGADWINGCTDSSRCGWKGDATLYVPGRFTTFVRHTVKATKQSISEFGTQTLGKLTRPRSVGEVEMLSTPLSRPPTIPSTTESRSGFFRRSTTFSLRRKD